MTYLITFSTYGSRLHGDERGSVDRKSNRPGDRFLDTDAGLERYRKSLMQCHPWTFDEKLRHVVLDAIVQHAGFRKWTLSAVHVRTTHVHIVVTGEATPERMMNEFKAYATRALKAMGSLPDGSKVWTRHGSTRWLNCDDSIAAAVQYVVDEQGERLAWFDSR